jgi:hypothetical protein
MKTVSWTPRLPISQPLAPRQGVYMPLGQAPQPLWVLRLELSGWAWSASQQRWERLDRVQLNPALTQLDTYCSCPIRWQLPALGPSSAP